MDAKSLTISIRPNDSIPAIKNRLNYFLNRTLFLRPDIKGYIENMSILMSAQKEMRQFVGRISVAPSAVTAVNLIILLSITVGGVALIHLTKD